MRTSYASSASGRSIDEVLAAIQIDQPGLYIVFYGSDNDRHGIEKRLASTGVPFIGCADAGRLVNGRYLLDEKTVAGMAISRSLIEAVTIDAMDISASHARADVKRESGERFRKAAAATGIDLANPDMKRDVVVNLAYGLSSANPYLEGQSEAGLMLQTTGGSSGGKLDFTDSSVISTAGSGPVATFAMLRLAKGFHFITNRISSFSKVEGKTLTASRLDGPRQIALFNGKPAAAAYAEALGLPEAALEPATFANYTLGIEPGDGERLITSIMTGDGKGGLLTYNDVVPDTRFNLYKAQLQVSERRKVYEGLRAPGLVAYLSFDCILCYLSRSSLKEVETIASLYEEVLPGVPKIGFGTFSESFCGANVNQTETFLAIYKD